MFVRSILQSAALMLLTSFLLSQSQAQPAGDDEPSFPLKARKVLFLGDSITHAGEYIALIESQLRLQGAAHLPEFINIGLASETCTGLSEDGHPFPRPNVHERLQRALDKVRPDVVVACYGMNDGIYHPFSEERFQAYQEGILRLVEAVHSAGAKIVLLTPPPFDAGPLRSRGILKPADGGPFGYTAMYENYDDVLTKYGEWIMTLGETADMVVDIHKPTAELLNSRRKSDPQFTIAPDGVHPNSEGHQAIAEAVLKAWGVESWSAVPPELLALEKEKTAVIHDAWLSEVGHLRPGIAAGLPVEQAAARARELEKQIEPIVENARKPAASVRPLSGGTAYHVHYPAGLAAGELRLSVDYIVWVPENVRHLRGIIVHQHGCGVGASLGGGTAADDLHWQALARKWDCALFGSTYEPREGVNCRLWCDARRGSDRRFLQALDHFAGATGHPELNQVPWCLWGHSGGAFWSSLMQAAHPERIVAIWLRSGTAFGYWSTGEIPAPVIPQAAYLVPVMGNPGLKEKDDPRFHVAWDGTRAMQENYLAHGAPFFEFAPDPRTGHECGDSRYLAIPYFDFWLKHRLPTPDSDAAADSQFPVLKPAADAVNEWTATMAAVQEEYIRTGAVSDSSPPPSPTAVRVQSGPDSTMTVTWTAAADFESGIRCFEIEHSGQLVATVPDQPAGRFGRPLFQSMSYHDTPEAPLPEMKFVTTMTGELAASEWSVRTINSAGLRSESAFAE